MQLLLMGPAGSGKTTLGRALALQLGIEFIEGDGLHSPANIEKMRRGEALSDADRGPWLDRVALLLQSHVAAGRSLILACSALKRTYRDRLRRADPDLRIVCVNAPQRVLESRVKARSGHYMPARLVADQCTQLELPAPDEHALLLDGELPVDAMADRVQAWLSGGTPERHVS